MDTPPESIACGRVHLHRWREEDLPALVAATRASWAHLRPWMPWAQDEPTAELQRPWLVSAQRQWTTREAFQFAMRIPGVETVVGSGGLMRRIGAGGLEIGYWVHVDYVGRGLATVAAAALTSFGFQLPFVDRMEIHCDAANVASAAVAARLGYVHVHTQPTEIATPAQSGHQQVWRLTASQWPTSAASAIWSETRHTHD